MKRDDPHLQKAGNGIYAFVLDGDLNIAGQSLNTRDGLGIRDAEKIAILADTATEFLLMEVPL